MTDRVATERGDGRRGVADRVLIAILLFFTFIGVGSWPWFAMAICLLIGGSAYLSQRSTDWSWVALPIAFAFFFLAASIIQTLDVTFE